MAVEIDAEKRMLHARIHSAGHLLDSALLCLGMNDLEPSKVRVHTSIAIMPIASLLILPDVCQTLIKVGYRDDTVPKAVGTAGRVN